MPTRSFTALTVFGGISWDTVVTVSRFLGPDEKAWAKVVGRFPGGMGANVAATYAALGGQVSLVSAVGRDAAGQASLATLRRVGVDTTRVSEGDGSTFETLAMIDGSGEKAMLLLDPPDLVAPGGRKIADPRPGHDAIHVAPSRFAPDFNDICRWHAAGAHTSFDIEPSMLDRGLDFRAYLRVASVVFCGEPASLVMAGSGTPQERARRLVDMGAECAVVTRGHEGAVVATRDGVLLERPGIRVEALNTTGAGDVFAGTFLFGLSSGWSIEQCLAAANFAGARCAKSYASQDADFTRESLLVLPEFSDNRTNSQEHR
jgi:sugar/nucleoside kinase (ribokinase family)